MPTGPERTRKQKNVPRTAAKPVETPKQETLTGADWKAVYAYVDKHPGTSQNDIVRHFSSKKDGALVFNQSTPGALSSKRARIVTRPDVERALVLWIRHMEEKGETVTGPMLKEKRRKFEEQLDVPEQEQLQGDGWVAPFCRAYGIKERRRHGEAGSKDRWNIDETSLIIAI